MHSIFLKPTNRHLLIVPHFKSNKKETGVLLPDDYEEEKQRHIVATVIDVAKDCSNQFDLLRKSVHSENKQIVIDSSMIETVDILDKKFNLILENYVLGILSDKDVY